MLEFDRKLIQAPLAGYSCAPFRKLARQWGKPDYCCTEMLSAKHIFNGSQQKKRYMYKDPDEGKLCIQLAGNQVDELVFAANEVVSWGADLIDLNCGCPQPKIRKKRYGSHLLADSKKLYEIVKALKQNIALPILVKIRVDNNSKDNYNQDIAKAIEDAGADCITVHGRHWKEDYSTPVSYKDIAEIKKSVSIPVIGNGDIVDTPSAKKMFDETGCDAIMIARASLGQPWLFEKIYQELQGKVFKEPTLKTVGEMLLQHVRGLIEIDTEVPAILQSRKLAKYYQRDLFYDALFTRSVNTVQTYGEFEKLITDNFA